MNLSRDDGQVAVLGAVFMVVALTVAALAIDGSLLFQSKLGLSHLADGAARAGAGAVDQQAFAASAGRRVVLDWREAEARAYRYLQDAGCDCDADVVATQRTVEVTLRREEPVMFTRILGVRTVTIGASSNSAAGDPDRAAP